jgi:choline dehydrogenase-like flavoprotein
MLSTTHPQVGFILGVHFNTLFPLRMSLVITNDKVSKYGAKEYAIDESIRSDLSDSALRKRLLKAANIVLHGSGTCAMGTVVDEVCKVRGVEGVRVVDSSVFPFALGAHYQAAACAFAEHVSAILD